MSAELKAKRGTLRPCRERPKHTTSKPPAKKPRAAAPRDYVRIADGYVGDVLNGRLVACQWVIKAAKRYRRMRERAAQRGGPFVFSTNHARDVCAFAERCPHVEGKWSAATVVLEPWQVFVLVACYGFRHHDGRRLVTSVFFQVSRKSAKSTLTAIAALYHLAVEKEPGGQAICAATTGSQARIVFGIMQKMVRQSPYLRELGLAVFANSITMDETGAFAKPINSKSSTQDGLNPSFISLDESHAQQFELHDVLKSAMGARPDGMMWMPTTAGYDLTSVGYTTRSMAMKLLDSVIEADHVFAILYELDEHDRWEDEAVWIKSAPMLGITPSLEWVRRYCLDAKNTPVLQGEFETKICNRWLHSARNWLSMPAWDRCADPTLTPDRFVGRPCWIGGDLAERDDLAAKALVFHEDDIIYAFVTLYLPRDVVEQRGRAVPEYLAWQKAGILKMTEGNMTDVTVIAADIRQDCERFEVQEICIERFGALNLHAQLDGLAPSIVLETKNAKSYTQPARELEARVKARTFRHDGNTCLKWQASNCVVDRRVDGSLLPKKESPESPNKIDAIDAILLAMSRLLDAPVEERSIYETRGFISL